MCAINGIYAYHYAANPVSEAELLTTRDAMANRGPDGEGVWIDKTRSMALAHRRLAIVDLSDAAAQPMRSPCGRFVISFNGEIYNYRELRTELLKSGVRFRSKSDTEVLLELYRAVGLSMVDQLRGMFAFAIWDTLTRQLVIVRDPLGIKPLYYADDGWTFRFASQVKALIAGGAVSRDPDPVGQTGFYLWGAVPEPHTIYREIRALPAGSSMRIDRIGPRPCDSYFSIRQAVRDAETDSRAAIMPVPDIEAEIAAALKDSVRHHLVSDVPVGAFLSAGIDSGAIVGLMRDCGAEQAQTITLRFDEFEGRAVDEAVLARQVAHQYGTRHIERVVTQEEFLQDLPRILDAMDQPSIDGINVWFAAKAAREQGLKVAISGLGGDELFGGYPSFADIPRLVRWLGPLSYVPLLGRAARLVASQRWQACGLHPKASGLIELSGSFADAYLLRRGLFLPAEIASLFADKHKASHAQRVQPHRARARKTVHGLQSAYGKVAALEMSFYLRNQLLRDTDWASMAHGVETRVPLVDHVLFRRAMPVLLHSKPERRKKILALAPRQPLPQAIVSRAKTGFTMPIEQWLAAARADARWQRKLPTDQSAASRTAPWARQWALLVGKETIGSASGDNE